MVSSGNKDTSTVSPASAPATRDRVHGEVTGAEFEAEAGSDTNPRADDDLESSLDCMLLGAEDPEDEIHD